MKDIPFHKTYLPQGTVDAVNSVLASGWLTTGKQVQIFQKEFGDLIGTSCNVAVSSCTAALHLAYIAHKIGPGDEVIVPSYTFCSTINTIIHTGATPVFCDVDENTLCADADDIEKRITKNTKGIVVVHFAGMPADMDRINKVAKQHKLFVIEDAAHAFMTQYKGRYIGQGTNITCFSFYATKNLTTVEGGMVTTADESLANFIRIMSMHGISKDAWKRYAKDGSWKYDVIAPGYKYNLTDLQAVIGLEQLKHAEKMQLKRETIISWYRKYLRTNKNILLPKDVPYENSRHAWHLFTIRVTDSSPINRDQLIDELKLKNIGTSVHFIPNHLQSYYKNSLKTEPLPVTEKVFSQIVSLPLFIDLTEDDVCYITDTINHLTK